MYPYLFFKYYLLYTRNKDFTAQNLNFSIIRSFLWLWLYLPIFPFLNPSEVLLVVDYQCIQYFRGAGYGLKSLLAGLYHSSQLSSFSSVWIFTFLFYFFELTHYHLGYFYAIIRLINFYNSWVLSFRQFFKPNY